MTGLKGAEAKITPERADNFAAVKAAHRTALETMTNAELVALLVADDPSIYPEDDWFRDLIVDVIKHRKVGKP